jgi:hypothetical protein
MFTLLAYAVGAAVVCLIAITILCVITILAAIAATALIAVLFIIGPAIVLGLTTLTFLWAIFAALIVVGTILRVL